MGIGSWDDFEWDPKTGIATFSLEDARGELTVVARLPQPTRPGHEDWEILGQRVHGVLSM